MPARRHERDQKSQSCCQSLSPYLHTFNSTEPHISPPRLASPTLPRTSALPPLLNAQPIPTVGTTAAYLIVSSTRHEDEIKRHVQSKKSSLTPLASASLTGGKAPRLEWRKWCWK